MTLLLTTILVLAYFIKLNIAVHLVCIMLVKKSIKIEGVVDFEWCPLGDKDKEEELKIAAGKSNKKPKENTLAYWTPEVANQPARVTLMQFPSRNILRQKNLFNVSEVCVLWSLRSFRINM